MRFLFASAIIAVAVAGCTQSPEAPSTAPAADEVSQASATDDASEAPAASQTADAETAKAAETLTIGQPAPQFEGLIGVDDQKHALDKYTDAKAVVVVFTCNSCPVAVAYEDRLVGLQNDYADKGVQLVAINVNKGEPDRLPAMKDRAAEKGFNFPYLYDPSQKVARDYGAMVTPHVYLLDGERRLAYVGLVDDNQDEAKVTQQHLRDAIDAVLAGEKPETTNTKPVGCSIKYEDQPAA